MNLFSMLFLPENLCSFVLLKLSNSPTLKLVYCLLTLLFVMMLQLEVVLYKYLNEGCHVRNATSDMHGKQKWASGYVGTARVLLEFSGISISSSLLCIF
ncbi:hypothetical protein L6452_13351 [Arctium lappa]|uniref:Uncharacterized protein n=1 Tax=Arctium lappa TaxID=4217 RepID=A0ACB9CIB9_ARCLA|nr:hypothetical protein L6452_13351 [Arctium lappa]